jgi:hypothetical protein
VTPTLLAGDRSLANVVAHEIAHSWTGNLVTNASWNDFWLNEGWTVFLERKILQRRSGDATWAFHAAGGWMDLKDEVRGAIARCACMDACLHVLRVHASHRVCVCCRWRGLARSTRTRASCTTSPTERYGHKHIVA